MDVFSFGLLLHYCLTGGQHPFGELYERDANILQRRVNLKHMQHLPEAANLVRGCCAPQGAWYGRARRRAGAGTHAGAGQALGIALAWQCVLHS